jgi:hypothetical protein
MFCLTRHPVNSPISESSSSGAGAIATRPSFFSSIPPERVGLCGEYDHNGLTKRVLQTFQTHIDTKELQQLTISQRGAVVVLVGKVRTRSLLERLSQLAYATYGAIEVETHGVRIVEPSIDGQSGHSFSVFSSSSYAF